MSNTTKPVFITSAVRKSFDAVQFDSIVSGLLPYNNTEAVKPSMLRQNKDSAIAAMGGKATPVSFVSGLLFLTAAVAWGQGRVEVLSASLPPIAVFALGESTKSLKAGAGVNRLDLLVAVTAAMQAVIALPLRTKEPKKVNSEVTTIEGESKREPDTTPSDADKAKADAERLTADYIKAERASIGEMDNKAAERAEAHMHMLAQEEARKAQEQAARLANLAKQAAEKMSAIAADRIRAVHEFRILADVIGVKLTPKQQAALESYMEAKAA